MELVLHESYLSFIESVPQSITSFAMEPPIQFFTQVSPRPLVSLSAMPNITHLTFAMEESDSEGESFIPWVIAQLSRFPAFNELHELHIWVTFYGRTSDNRWARIWTTLDDVLAEPMFQSIQSVHIKAHIRLWLQSKVDVTDSFKSAFSRAVERNSLYIEHSRERNWTGLL
ncbi:hypothetical protein AX16_005169 [Volvariella volvacea WC 439]|nr:hypothetical protein AX16_005169 [Volvariella volvacea WC 439]